MQCTLWPLVNTIEGGVRWRSLGDGKPLIMRNTIQNSEHLINKLLFRACEKLILNSQNYILTIVDLCGSLGIFIKKPRSQKAKIIKKREKKTQNGNSESVTQNLFQHRTIDENYTNLLYSGKKMWWINKQDTHQMDMLHFFSSTVITMLFWGSVSQDDTPTWAPTKYKDHLSKYGDSHYEFIMGIPILVRPSISLYSGHPWSLLVLMKLQWTGSFFYWKQNGLSPVQYQLKLTYHWSTSTRLPHDQNLKKFNSRKRSVIYHLWF